MTTKQSSSGIRVLALYACVLLFALFPQIIWAANTPAGTRITNQASVNYLINGSVQAPVSSLVVSLLVDEVIDPVATCQSSPTIAVNSPSINDVVSYVITNSGNGTQTFSLARTNGGGPTATAGNYNPVDSVAYSSLNTPTGAIFLETNGQAGFQPGSDAVYIPGTNDPVIPAGKGLTVYVVSDTPSVPVNAVGNVLLTATSMTTGAAGAAVGTRLVGKGANLGNGPGNAIVVTPGAASSATCSYTASGLGFVMNKSVLSVVDKYGGAVIMPGSIITYQIAVNLNGIGSATNLVITDPLPANVTYVTGSIKVNNVAKTDAIDGDNAQYSATTTATSPANSISVSLGNVAAPSSTFITFSATVN